MLKVILIIALILDFVHIFVCVIFTVYFSSMSPWRGQLTWRPNGHFRCLLVWLFCFHNMCCGVSVEPFRIKVDWLIDWLTLTQVTTFFHFFRFWCGNTQLQLSSFWGNGWNDPTLTRSKLAKTWKNKCRSLSLTVEKNKNAAY